MPIKFSMPINNAAPVLGTKTQLTKTEKLLYF